LPFVGAALRFLIVRCPASSTCPHPAPERPPRTRYLSSVGAVEWQPGALWAQCIPMLGACRGAPRSKTRISFLYYIGSFAVWRGVEYGPVHAISACTGGVRTQFENCGYRRQYSKSAYAPLCRRYNWSAFNRILTVPMALGPGSSCACERATIAPTLTGCTVNCIFFFNCTKQRIDEGYSPTQDQVKAPGRLH